MSGDWLELGRIGSPFGVRGWVHVESFTDPREALLDYGVWRVGRAPQGMLQRRVLEARPQGRKLVACLEGITTREDAVAIVGARIEIERAALPPLGEREHYQADLIGYAVRNVEGIELGTVAYFVDLPANPVMVVEGGRSHWVPMRREQLLKVDRAARTLLVDWPAEI
jgi:16S rRNA processing protein RimM